MKSLKSTLPDVPEYYLIVLVLLSGYTPPAYIHPPFIVIALLLLAQIVFRNRYTGIAIAVLFSLANLFMLLALLSEFREFPTFDDGAKQLLFVGLPLLGLNFLMGGLMIHKYLKAEPPVGTAV